MEVEGFSRLQPIGSGGLGDVYAAVRSSTGSKVAIKMLRDWADSSASWRRVRRELTALVGLRGHPNVVNLEEIIELNGVAMLVMEFAAGGAVSDLLKREGKVAFNDVVLIGEHTATALSASHQLGIIHLDIKPHNLLIGGFGQVKVCDFGIAALTHEEQFKTRTNAASYRYSSPEQLNEEPAVGPPSDVYSLGVTLAHLAAGSPLPVVKGDEQWAERAFILQRSDIWNSEAQDRFEDLVNQCVQYRPDARPSAVEMADELSTISSLLGARRSRALTVLSQPTGQHRTGEVGSQNVNSPESPGANPGIADNSVGAGIAAEAFDADPTVRRDVGSQPPKPFTRAGDVPDDRMVREAAFDPQVKRQPGAFAAPSRDPRGGEPAAPVAASVPLPSERRTSADLPLSDMGDLRATSLSESADLDPNDVLPTPENAPSVAAEGQLSSLERSSPVDTRRGRPRVHEQRGRVVAAAICALVAIVGAGAYVVLRADRTADDNSGPAIGSAATSGGLEQVTPGGGSSTSAETSEGVGRASDEPHPASTSASLPATSEPWNAPETVAKYSNPTQPIGVSEPLTGPPEKRTIAWFNCEFDSCKSETAAMTEAAGALGWEVKVFDYTKEPNTFGAALQQAVDADPDFIAARPILEPHAYPDQMRQAAEKGITILSCPNNSAASSNLVPIQQCDWSNFLVDSARIMADWVSVDSGGTAAILVVTTFTKPALSSAVNAFKNELSANCPQCAAVDLEVTEVQVANGEVPAIVSNALNASPETKYVFFPDASVASSGEGVASALSQSETLKNVTVVGTAFWAPQMQDLVNGTRSAWSARPDYYEVWLMVDAAARHSLGMAINGTGVARTLPTTIIQDPEQARQILEQGGVWSPPDMAGQFKRLWGVG